MTSKVINSSLLRNTSWGLLSNILQILFVLGFFIIIARKYTSLEFGQFLIASTIYQIVSAFASLGLGQWFIRQYVNENEKTQFAAKFLKTQAGLGIAFYFINIALAYLLYEEGEILFLCIILGTNILFDNLINAIKSLNIAEGQQRKTAIILATDGFLKLLVASILFFYAISPAVLAMIMVAARILTLGLFLRLGSSGLIGIRTIINSSIALDEIKLQIIKNWQFIIIGSISIIYWRLGNIIISKMLTIADVANYEIAFRILSVLIILPVVASATIYPRFITLFNNNDLAGLKRFYQSLFKMYTLISILTYVSVYCFADLIMPLLFGQSYPEAVLCVKQMFLTYLLFPTVLLQANLLVAMGMEKLDMWFNILSLLANVAGCIIGLYIIKDLAMINYSVLVSFIIFHLLQDMVLIKKKITTIAHCLIFYGVLTFTVLSFEYSAHFMNPYVMFGIFLTLIILALLWLTENSNTHTNPEPNFSEGGLL